MAESVPRWRAEISARRGWDIRDGNHNSKNSEFSAGNDQGSEHPSQPRLAQRVEFLIPTAVTYGMQVESLPL